MKSCDSNHARLGLRERKKLKTQQAIQEQALRLFAERGFDETTVEQIADAAEVSPSTFFRYYPTKEDVVLRDEYDPIIMECLLSQPRDKPPLQAVRDALRAAFSSMSAAEEQQMLARYRMGMSTPAVRVRLVDEFLKGLDLFTNGFAEWRGLAPRDPAVRTFVGAVYGVIQQGMIDWVESEGSKGFAATVDEYLARLEGGLKI
jgi:AcrR family transcriptional regulator